MNTFQNKQSAFSLVEIVLALGVMAFAMVAIMGILPIATKSARESLSDSRSAFIAQTVFSNLRATPFATAKPTEELPDTLNLAVSNTEYFGFDSNGKALKKLSGDTIGANDTNVEFVVKINSKLQFTTAPYRRAHVTVSVQEPAPAAEAQRKKYDFVTLIAE